MPTQTPFIFTPSAIDNFTQTSTMPTQIPYIFAPSATDQNNTVLILVVVFGVVVITLCLVVEIFLLAALFRVRRKTFFTRTKENQYEQNSAVLEHRPREYLQAVNVLSMQEISNIDEQQMYADMERLGSVCLFLM